MYPRFIQLIIKNQLDQSIPSPTPPTPPPQQPHDLPSTSQVQHTLPQSPQPQPQPQPQAQQQATDFPISDTVMEDASNQGRMIDDLDSYAGVALMDDKEEEKKVEEANVAGDDQEDEPSKVQEVVDVVTTAKLITEVVTAASESVTAASTTISAAEPQVPAVTITDVPVRVAAASTRRRKGVVIMDPKEESTTIIPADTKSKDKGKGIMKTQVNLQLQVQRVRTDNGTEFKNKTLAKFFDEVGITQQFSAARTPQQNGVVERRDRTLVEAARTMLKFAFEFGMENCDTFPTPIAEQAKLKLDLVGKPIDHTDYRAKSKYVAVSGCCAQVLWMRTQLTDYGFFYNKASITVIQRVQLQSRAIRISSWFSWTFFLKELSWRMLMELHDNCVSLSTAESEYVVVSSCCAQVLWMRTQLTDYGFFYDKVPIYYDSKSAIANSCNPVQHTRTKHIDE
nr:hypothetical protein [Tanacetum cinerariifolium]